MLKATTVDTLNAMFAKRKSDMARRGEDEAPLIKSVSCADGTSLSVQASRKHHCWPKNNEGPYTQVEVGFPSKPPPSAWAEHCLGNFNEKPCDSRYGAVPMSKVAEFIDLHGGFKPVEAPKLVLPPAPAPVHRTRVEERRWNLTLEDMGVKL